MAHAFFTVGHSTRSVSEFIELLCIARVATVVDVRAIPRSGTNPQFNSATLPISLAESAIGYEHIAALGGRRGSSLDAAHSPNGFWVNQSFRNYADYALGESFHAGLARLRLLGQERRCAIMCAEAVWWRCHRRIIADYLIAGGESVFHIMSSKRIDPAHLTPAARVGSDGRLIYAPLDPTASARTRKTGL